MVTMHPTTQEVPDVEFWQQCRQRAQRLNVPAWEVAENEWVQRELDKKDTHR
tara:strand:- start:449 stop:604 length:156 start_codon:yes stop_codon:yes gene_type:complete